MSSSQQRVIVSILVVVLTIFLVLELVECRPQIEHGSLNGPSGRFERTRDLAVPPLDPKLPPIVLPEATPVHEDNGEVPNPPKYIG